jgi:uncharacterized protein (DUF1919 family)
LHVKKPLGFKRLSINASVKAAASLSKVRKMHGLTFLNKVIFTVIVVKPTNACIIFGEKPEGNSAWQNCK